MQDLFFIFFCFLSIINIIIKGSDNFFDDYMELDNTNCIIAFTQTLWKTQNLIMVKQLIKVTSHYIAQSVKGIFVWLILFCHKRSYGNNKYYIYLIIIGKLGQKVVSMFLFYSSFGICESN